MPKETTRGDAITLPPACWLTTIDNPFDPFTELLQWLSFDKAAGYNSLERWYDEAEVLDTMSDVEQVLELERAIDAIVISDPIGIFKKVYETRRGVNEASASVMQKLSPVG